MAVLKEERPMELQPWQRLVLESLRELSDASFQARVWLRGEGDEISSPTETINQLFDDSGLSELLEDGLVFSQQADSLLRELSTHVDTIDFDRSVDQLLADQQWAKLRDLAAAAVKEVSLALQKG